MRYPELNEMLPWDTHLYTPPAVVSMQEHHQIERRLDSWAKALAVSLLCPLMQIWFIVVSRHPRFPCPNYHATFVQYGLHQLQQLFRHSLDVLGN